MSRVYKFGAGLSGCLAGVCAVLALLATPSAAQADQLSDCMAFCQGLSGQQNSMCMGACMAGGPGTAACPWKPSRPCDIDCFFAPACGIGTCRNNAQCTNCTCKVYSWPQGINCECQ
jgi:hypothetical protein